MASRANRLGRRLEELSELNDRPSSALHARSLSLVGRLVSGAECHAEIFSEIQDVIKRAEGLLGFPLEPLADIIIELGRYYDGDQQYEDLHDTLMQLQSRRAGDVQTSRMLLRRGHQQYRNGRYAEASRTLGRAFGRLSSQETRGHFAHALDLCAINYQKLGLLWAARGTAVYGAYVAAGDFWSHSTVRSELVELARKTKWFELQLGRVPQSLSWYRLECLLEEQAAEAGTTQQADTTLLERHRYDHSLGILLLRSTMEQLPRLSRLPAALRDLGLLLSSCSLRWALGDDEATIWNVLFEDEGVGEPNTQDDLKKFFARMLTQPAAKGLPDKPELGDGPRTILRGVVVGCSVVIDSSSQEPAPTVSEAILGSLQAFLAIGIADNVMPSTPQLTIVVETVEDQTISGITHRIWELKGRPHVDVSVSKFDPHLHSLNLRKSLVDSLSCLILEVFAHTFVVGDLEHVVVPWLRDDEAMNRSMGVLAGFGSLASIFGDDYRCSYITSIEEWWSTEVNEVPLTRTVLWRGDTEMMPSNLLQPGVGPPPDDLRLNAGTSHADVAIHSIIRIPLWDRADWHATGFATDLGGSRPPLTLALIFRKGRVGQQIFRYLREDVGAADPRNRLRVVIIRGVRRRHQPAYRVLISSNFPAEGGSKFFYSVSRYCEMGPDSDRNIDLFLQRYKEEKEFLLAPGKLRGAQPDISFEDAILKSDLVVKWAYEIGRNDLDGVAIRYDDDVYIPSGLTSPPIVELLAWMQDHKQSTGREWSNVSAQNARLESKRKSSDQRRRKLKGIRSEKGRQKRKNRKR